MADKRLEQVVVNDIVWGDIAREALSGHEGVEEQVERYGASIVACVVSGNLSVANLREAVQWANNLDRETVATSDGGGELERFTGEDYTEAVGRRIMHGSLRHALRSVKSRDRLKNLQVRVNAREQWFIPGMGQLEAKDRQDKYLLN